MGIWHARTPSGRNIGHGRWIGLTIALSVAMGSLTAPSTAAWAALAASGKGQNWVPPNHSVGDTDHPVAVHDLQVTPLKKTPPPASQVWHPAPPPPLQTGTATVTLGPDGQEAKAARALSAGVAPSSSGQAFAQAGTLPVSAAAAIDPAVSAAAVTVSVTDQATGRAAGVNSPLITLSTPQPAPQPGTRQAKVAIDPASWQGPGWADRTRLVSLPACALTHPERAECRTQTPVASQVDPATGQVSAEVTLSPTAAPSAGKPETAGAQAPAAQTAAAPVGATVLATTTAPSGPGGDYSATPLTPSAAWSSGPNTGSFTYSYPIQTPSSVGGGAPTVALTYNSAAVDGRTSATNSQSSWLGDGWGYNPGFIERSYQSCSIKDSTGTARINGSGDRCWSGQNATLSLAGHSGTLVRADNTGVWHLQNDDGSKVEQITASTSDNKVVEYWRVSTSDGMEYYFGRNHLPGGDGSDPETKSALTVPVYSPAPGDPCYDPAKGAGSWCQMGWRWQLDYVVDTHKNLITYTYKAEQNTYNRGAGQNNGNGTLTNYQRGATLAQIGYGLRLPDQIAAKGSLPQPARVLFDADKERCDPDGTTFSCAESERSSSNARFWPDTPLDQICPDAGPCANAAPTFFSTKKLTGISTEVLVDAKPVTVDSWEFAHTWYNPNDTTAKTLWLSAIKRSGTNGQAKETLPAVTFAWRGIANRVDGLVPAAPRFWRPRVSEIVTETGGKISVNYIGAGPDQASAPGTDRAACSRVEGRMPVSADNNPMACLPSKWYRDGSTTPVDDWFLKPLVATVTETDAVTGPSVSKTTTYTYNGDAAWHRNDSEFADSKTRTWDDFRGYQSVTTTTGSAQTGEAPLTRHTVTYLRGMNGDLLADGKTTRATKVTNPVTGTATDDDNWLAGSVLATEAYDKAGPGGTVTSRTTSLSTGSTVTATRTYPGRTDLRPLEARYPADQLTTVTQTRLTGDQWRTATTVAKSEPAYGNRLLWTDDQGDGTSSTPRLCTTRAYATSTNSGFATLIAEQTTTTGSCGTPATKDNTVSSVRTLFDNKPFKQAGDLGDITSTQILDHYDPSGRPVYALTATAAYDTYGRNTRSATTDGSTYDKDGNQLTSGTVTPAATSTTRTPSSAAIPKTVTTDGPMPGWTSTVVQDPGRSTPLTATDANGRTTTSRYDGLGRIKAVWLPGRPTDQNANRKFDYTVNGITGPSAVTTHILNEHGTTYSGRTELFDGLGRLRQTQQSSPSKDAGRLITDTAYDSHGWPIKSSAPYYDDKSAPAQAMVSAQDSQIPAQTWTTYDGQGRVLRRSSAPTATCNGQRSLPTRGPTGSTSTLRPAALRPRRSPMLVAESPSSGSTARRPQRATGPTPTSPPTSTPRPVRRPLTPMLLGTPGPTPTTSADVRFRRPTPTPVSPGRSTTPTPASTTRPTPRAVRSPPPTTCSAAGPVSTTAR